MGLRLVRYLHDAGAATQLLTIEARQSLEDMQDELHAAPAVDEPSEFWRDMGWVNEQLLNWGVKANFKRTLNQNYFNFVPSASSDPRVVRMRRLTRHLPRNALEAYTIEDPDRDPSSWISCYPDYYILQGSQSRRDTRPVSRMFGVDVRVRVATG